MKKNNLPLNEPGDLTMFKIPEKYFENFSLQLNKRLDIIESEKDLHTIEPQAETKPKRYFLTMNGIKPILYMAAMFVLLLFSIGMILNFTSKKATTTYTASTHNVTKTQNESSVLTAEDYLINSVGTYGISQYYVDPESFE
jgi:hypothetical protein